MTDQPADSTLTTKQKLSINWFSNAPWANTGYGVQTRINVRRLAKLYPLTLTAFYGLEGGRINFEGIPVYPRAMHPYGMDVIGAHAEHMHANALITLMDAWVVQPENTSGINWYPWFPVDHEPITPMVYDKVKQAKKGITMSRFGQKQAEKMGLETYYVPHAVETDIYKPMNMKESRERLGFPQDKFIVGMVAANKGNPSRKSFFEQITAFKAFHKVHPDSMLYLHTMTGALGGDCVNLKKFCEVMELKTGIVDCRPLSNDVDVAFVEQYQYIIGIIDPYLADVYNACDVTMLASMGEGFGIPLIESQACGCPVITGEWTAMGELCFSGWKIPKSEATPTFTGFESFQWLVKPEAVAERLFKAYMMKGNLVYRKNARDGAMKYDADRVVERFWKPVLADIEANL